MPQAIPYLEALQLKTVHLFNLHFMLPLPCLKPCPAQFDMSLAIPFLKASLTDAEYQLCTSVAADNFAGGNLLPSDACCSLSAFFIDISCSPGSHWTTLLVRACALVGVWA